MSANGNAVPKAEVHVGNRCRSMGDLPGPRLWENDQSRTGTLHEGGEITDLVTSLPETTTGSSEYSNAMSSMCTR